MCTLYRPNRPTINRGSAFCVRRRSGRKSDISQSQGSNFFLSNSVFVANCGNLLRLLGRPECSDWMCFYPQGGRTGASRTQPGQKRKHRCLGCDWQNTFVTPMDKFWGREGDTSSWPWPCESERPVRQWYITAVRQPESGQFLRKATLQNHTGV